MTAKLSGGSAIQYDKNGVPQWDGAPETFKEWQDRSWDLYYGRAGNDSLQIATAIHLRSGLSGTAYEVVRGLDHAKLATAKDGKALPGGMELLIATLTEAIETEKPVKTQEIFLRVFYAETVWRSDGESMQEYQVRRAKEFDELKEVSKTTAISDDIRAMLLLTFSGLDNSQIASVLSSTGNEYDLKKMGHAMRIQFPNIHQHRTNRHALPVFGGTGRSGGNGFRQGRSQWLHRKLRQVMMANTDDSDNYGYQDDSVYNDSEYYYEDSVYAETEGDETASMTNSVDDEGEVEVLINEIAEEYGMADIGDLDQEEMECFAAILQNRKKLGRRKGKGKGRGRGRGRGKPSSPSASSSASRSNAGGPAMPFKAQGLLAFTSKDREARRTQIAGIKAKTQCSECGQFGHWHGDPACPKKGQGSRGKGTGTKTKTSYFVLREDDAGEAEAYVVTVGKCNHEFDTTRSIRRGANGDCRYLTCTACSSAAISCSRRQPEEMWAYLFFVAMRTHFGAGRRQKELCDRIYSAKAQALQDEAWVEVPAVNTTAQRGAQGSNSCWHCGSTDINIHSLQCPRYTPEPRPAPSTPQQQAAPTTPGSGNGYIPPTPKASHPPPHARITRPTAKISRASTGTSAAYVYGIFVASDAQLPVFPALDAEDCDILHPLPNDGNVIDFGRFAGQSYKEMALDTTNNWYNVWCLKTVLKNEGSICAGLYRYGFYLFQLVILAFKYARHHSPPIVGNNEPDPNERVMNVDHWQLFHQPIQMQVQMDPNGPPYCQECQVMMVDAEGDAGEEDIDLGEAQVLRTSMEDPPGLAIVDTACQQTVNGRAWRDQYEHELEIRGLRGIAQPKKQAFRGIGGRVISEEAITWPVGIGGCPGELTSSQLPDNSPMLLSRALLEQLGAIVDVAEKKITFTALGVYDQPLTQTNSGHLAIDLLEFPRHSADRPYLKFQMGDDEEIPDQDEPDSWTHDATQKTWTRHHRSLRTSPFSPLDTNDANGPDVTNLTDSRSSYALFLSGNTWYLNDSWRSPDETQAGLRAMRDHAWRGTTTFYIKPDVPPEEGASDSGMPHHASESESDAEWPGRRPGTWQRCTVFFFKLKVLDPPGTTHQMHHQ